MYSRDQTFNHFLQQAKRKHCLTETQLGSVVGINTLEYYSRLFVFICLDPNNSHNSIYLQFTLWDHSVIVALINRKPIIPEQPVAAIYEDSVIEVVNPNPDHPKLRNFSCWLEWACQKVDQQILSAA